VRSTVVVFVTVNARGRKRILANPEAAETILAAWRAADAWAIGRYVLLPDHLHLFCTPRDPAVPLERWVAYWKSLASRRWPRPTEKPLWQKSFWDTELRTYERYDWKWLYVLADPERRGLVARAEEWPFAGEIECLE
jgi:REP element-mobilizing transposase RayT